MEAGIMAKKKEKTLEELLKDVEVKKSALNKIVKKIKYNSNQKPDKS
ncbi:MAG: hypothetical protein R3279_10865 [Putridiphycobacter sp.]|nr:hypothetical protein [Putridiphycobacter sp.]